VHVISRKRLNEFTGEHPDAKSALGNWYRAMKARRFANFVQLREVFPGADQVDNKTVFNIGGNNTGAYCGNPL
jgi:mRNA interferase HigB